MLVEGKGRTDDGKNWDGGIIPSGGVMYLQAPHEAVALNVNGVLTLSGITGLGEGQEPSWNVRNRYNIGRGSVGSGIRFVSKNGEPPAIRLPDVRVAIIRLTVSVDGTEGLQIIGAGDPVKIQMVIWEASPDERFSFSGGIEVLGARLTVSDSDKLGDNSVTLSGIGSRLELNAATEVGMDFSTPIVLNSENSGLTYHHSGQLWTMWVTSTISETPGSKSNMIYAANTVAPDGGRFVISGDNTYTGDTQIGGDLEGPVYVRIRSNTALGSAPSSVTFHSQNCALELEAGITVSGKTITIGGGGFHGNGMLINQSDENIWEGDVVLANHAPGIIGVLDGQLTISGKISSATPGGLVKKGKGTLKLTGANKYTSGTTIEQGWIVAGNDTALGRGDITLNSNSGLGVDAGTRLSGIGTLALAPDSLLRFDLGSGASGAMLSVSSQTGNETYTVDLAGTEKLPVGQYVLMSVSGSHKAAGFTLGKAGFGSAVEGRLDWTRGVLTLRVAPKAKP